MQQTSKEKKNKQIGGIISVGAHVLVILLFLFIVAWRAPDPPLPEIGIELNFGLDDAGSGEEQPEPRTSPAESVSEEDATPDGLEELTEEVSEDQTPVEEVVESVEQPAESNDLPEEAIDPVTNTQDSPDVVEEKAEPKSEIKEETIKKEVKEVEKPKAPPVLYPNNKTGAGGKEGDSTESQNANNGDKSNVVGDKGNKDGTLDSRALYGNSGGGGGSSLQMSGWMWDSEPKPKDTSSESGKLVFQVIIDNKGNIIRVKTIESGVSPTVEKVYRDEVMKLTFSKTSGTSVATSSTGTITFVIKAR